MCVLTNMTKISASQVSLSLASQGVSCWEMAFAKMPFKVDCEEGQKIHRKLFLAAQNFSAGKVDLGDCWDLLGRCYSNCNEIVAWRAPANHPDQPLTDKSSILIPETPRPHISMISGSLDPWELLLIDLNITNDFQTYNTNSCTLF